LATKIWLIAGDCGVPWGAAAVQGAGLSGAGWDTTGSRTKRFDVYKRALMLTAATVALVSGPAFGAADNITTKITTPLTTANNGPITLNTNGSIVIPSNSSATAAAAAVTINSTTPANNVFTSISGTTLSFNNTSFAEGIQADPGFTGEIVTGGTMDLTGSGASKNGIMFGDPTGATSGTFTGIVDTTNNTNGDLTAAYIQAGSTIAVQGDGSSDIAIFTGNTVTGDIVVAGSMTDEATSLTATSNSVTINAVNISGTLNGIFSVAAGGSIVSTGAGAEGILDIGQINGSITNFGSIETVGTATVKATTGNPQAGSALIISGNVTGGIYNGGPGNGDTTTARAIISTLGTVPAVNITPAFGTTTAAPITIGGFSDPDAVFGNVSFLNRGVIKGTAQNIDTSSSAVALNGVSTVNSLTLSDGLVNAGAINSTITTDVKAVTTSSLTTALFIGNFVTLNANTGTANNGFGGGYALVNSNESASLGDGEAGVISATVSGAGAGTAVGINIGSTTTGSGTSVSSLYNSGTISASATSTDLTISNLRAYAILDNSGSLLQITNTGTISATATALNNFTNTAQAINLANASGGATIDNSGVITGDIELGQYADTISVTGTTAQSASVTGNIFFNGNIGAAGTSDTLIVGTDATVTGNILEQVGSTINASVAAAGVLDITNNGLTVNNQALPNGTAPNFVVNSLTVKAGGTLDLTLSQAFNQQTSGSIIPVVQASGSASTITLSTGTALNLNFGSFVGPTNTGGTTSQFVIFDAPSNQLIIQDPQTISQDIIKDIPFLFNGSVCGYNVSGFTPCATAPDGTTHSDVVLNLTAKSASAIGLTGYAAKMFPLANQALANDTYLGAAIIAAGVPSGTGQTALTTAEGQKIYQGIYTSFAPDVTGADRAIAISITDQATGAVGARQRALRMYAGLDGDATMWGQQFGQRLNTGNSAETTGYANTGYGFALGADSGDPHDGRYGGAFTFYSGTTSEKPPRTSKARSEWVMLTGYSDWRGHGFFFDSQLSAAYGNITGKRSIVIGNSVAECNDGETCTVQGKRPAAMLAGGMTTGTIYHSGGTVFIPQLSLDALTMREDGYTEATPNLVSQATSGFDLHVKPYYANSVRAFAGADLRQDLKFGDYFVQPEARAGFRYDLLDGAQKLRAEFACSAVATGGCGDTSFSISGPDPAKGNIVLGGGLAITTGAWSLGLNYDYLRGVGGTKSVDQTATFTLVGRI
jgi:hypothetical protein